MRHQDLCIYHTHCGGIQTKPTSSCQEKDHIFTRDHSALSYTALVYGAPSALGCTGGCSQLFQLSSLIY